MRIKAQERAYNRNNQASAEAPNALGKFCLQQIEKLLGRPLSVVRCQLFYDFHAWGCSEIKVRVHSG